MSLLPLSCRRRIMLFPSGNWSDQNKRQRRHMAVYVECPDLDGEEPGWGLQATFVVTLVNQRDPSSDFRKGWHRPCTPEPQSPHAHTHYTPYTIITIIINTAITTPVSAISNMTL